MANELIPFCQFVFHERSYPIHVKKVTAGEPYKHHGAREFVPLTVDQGERTKIKLTFHSLDPELPRLKGKRTNRVGDAQAWFYHEDRILLFWRAALSEGYEVANPLDDQNLWALWHEGEQFLRNHFPGITLLITPAWNNQYDLKQWRTFLNRLGYTEWSPVGLSYSALIKYLTKPPAQDSPDH